MAQQRNERNLMAGYDIMGNIFPFTDLGVFILGWYSVTLEVFLRRDFGERYFNRVNFWAGNLAMLLWVVITYVFSALAKTFSVLGGGAGMTGRVGAKTLGEAMNGGVTLILIFWLLYNIFSVMHFLRIWWRNRTDDPLHSLDPGKSRLEPFAKMLLGPINKLAEIPVRIFARALSAEDRAKLPQALPIIDDVTGFTERVVEPVTVYILGTILLFLGMGGAGLWMMFSAAALSIYTNYLYEAWRHQFLDMRDQILEATHMEPSLTGKSDAIRVTTDMKRTVQSLANQAENHPEMMESIRMQNLSIAAAMTALNPNLKNIGTKKETE